MKSLIPPIWLAACSAAPQADLPAQHLQTVQPVYSSADSLLLLLNTPETFDVLQRHIPFFVNLTEHGIIPPFPTDMPLDHLLSVPQSQVTKENIAAINAELAKIPREAN
jgi:hypothetical protein